jgi:hypothetical protein
MTNEYRQEINRDLTSIPHPVIGIAQSVLTAKKGKIHHLIMKEEGRGKTQLLTTLI